MHRLILLALTLAAPAAAKPGGGEAGRLLALGDSLAEAGDFDGAEAAYATSESWGWTSTALAHNRGVAALRAGRVGEAVGHLLRARQMAPADPSVVQSLAAARAAAGIRVTPEGGAWSIVRAVARPAGIAGLLATAALLGLGAVAVRRRRPAAAGLGAAAVVIWGIAAAAWVDTAPRATLIAPAIVRAAPAGVAAERAQLRVGRSIEIAARDGSWLRVDGGWIPAHVATSP